MLEIHMVRCAHATGRTVWCGTVCRSRFAEADSHFKSSAPPMTCGGVCGVQALQRNRSRAGASFLVN